MVARFYLFFWWSPTGSELLQAGLCLRLGSTFSASTCFLLLGPKGPTDPSAKRVTADKVLHTEENLPARQIREWGERSRREGEEGGMRGDGEEASGGRAGAADTSCNVQSAVLSAVR